MDLVHYTWLTANHWCKGASEAVAHARDPFTFVNVPTCLVPQGDCDEMLVIWPDQREM